MLTSTCYTYWANPRFPLSPISSAEAAFSSLPSFFSIFTSCLFSNPLFTSFFSADWTKTDLLRSGPVFIGLSGSSFCHLPKRGSKIFFHGCWWHRSMSSSNPTLIKKANLNYHRNRIWCLLSIHFATEGHGNKSDNLIMMPCCFSFVQDSREWKVDRPFKLVSRCSENSTTANVLCTSYVKWVKASPYLSCMLTLLCVSIWSQIRCDAICLGISQYWWQGCLHAPSSLPRPRLFHICAFSADCLERLSDLLMIKIVVYRHYALALSFLSFARVLRPSVGFCLSRWACQRPSKCWKCVEREA